MSNVLPTSGETDFIQRYLAPLAKDQKGAFGLSDDAAALEVGDGSELVATVDAVASGVHFFPDDVPADIAWKALAVNVSDLVAKGASPVGYLMSVAFPDLPKSDWMDGFCGGLGAAQSVFGISLAGGDTDLRSGPLAVTITALGRVPRGKMVRRSGGAPGDILYLTGTIGDAGAGLSLRQDGTRKVTWQLSDAEADFLLNRYHRPKPRHRLTPILLRYARAAIDISDGLVKDATALAHASGTGLLVHCAKLPVSEPARRAVAGGGVAPQDLITAGGDYEVLAAVSRKESDQFAAESESAGVAVTEIGRLTGDTDGIVFEGPDGAPLEFEQTGYDHFYQTP